MDSLTPEERSKLMSKIRGKDTQPELMVRSMLHRAGYRFSLHRPGAKRLIICVANNEQREWFTTCPAGHVVTIISEWK